MYGEDEAVDKLFGTSDEYLRAAVDEVSAAITLRIGRVVPPVRVSVGFPAGGIRSNVEAQTFPRKMSLDGINEIFIRPTVHDAQNAIELLMVELVRAAYDGRGDTGKRVNASLEKVGFNVSSLGKLTAYVPSPALRMEIKGLADSLGAYPREEGLNIVLLQAKKQTTRMVRIECTSCGYTFRTSDRWIRSIEIQCPDKSCGGEVQVG